MDIEYWELIAKKFNGELSSEEERRLTIWLKSDTTNQQRLKEAENIWRVSGSLKSEFEPNTEKAWQTLKEQIENSERIKPLPVHRRIWLKVAAAFVATLMIGFFVKFIVNDVKEDGTKSVLVEIITTDSIKVFYLSDKTRISLNKNSHFTYPENFNDSLRIVTLIGEVFFEVTPNHEKPFIVQAGQTQTRVLGTSFNIKAYEKEDDIQVTVVTGKVMVEIDDNSEIQPVMLEAGDEVTYNKTNTSVKKQKSKNTDFMWWKGYGIEKKVKQLFKRVKKINLK